MVVFVQHHDFTATRRPMIGETMPRMQRTDTEIHPPSAPLMGAPRDPNEPADIPEPAVPAGTISAGEEAIFGPEPTLADEAMAQAVPGLPAPVPEPELVLPAAPGEASERVAFDQSPALPASAEPLLRGFTQYMHAQLQSLLQDESMRIAKAADVTIASMADYCRQVLQTAAYAQNDVPDAIRSLAAEGVKVIPMPYQVRISATAPGGFQVEFTLQKATAEEMIGAVTGLEQWLSERGYGSVVVHKAA
jgi:hypothetical protein